MARRRLRHTLRLDQSFLTQGFDSAVRRPACSEAEFFGYVLGAENV